MKIGIYLAYAPHGKHFSLKQEGLGRYLSALLKAFIENKDEVTIACPKWSLYALEELLDENKIDKGKVKFITPRNTPVIFRIYTNSMDKKKSKKRANSKLSFVFWSFVEWCVDILFSITSFSVAVLLLLGVCLLAILLVPCVLVGIIFLILWKVFSVGINLFKRGKEKISLRKWIKNNAFVIKVCTEVRNKFNVVFLREKMRQACADDIVRKINHLKEKPDLWYCPMAFWEEFNDIDGIKVICAPDLVTTEFALKFSEAPLGKATEEVRKTIERGEYFITYCNYLKESLLVNKFNKDPRKIIAIPHGVNDSSKYVCFYDKNKNVLWNESKSFSRKILEDVYKKSLNVQYYLHSDESKFDMKNVRYIFYASQIRANKNMLNLIKAYNVLLREYHVPVKLFLTGYVLGDVQLSNYIFEHRLQYDVIFFHSVTNQQLAALYQSAELVVNPTFYEGGFPFTFGEGMSVGTPSVMSDIPQVREAIAGYSLEAYVFDPYDYRDLAKKIVYGLEHKEELFHKESKLFEAMAGRTWEDVGREYVKAFEYFARI